MFDLIELADFRVLWWLLGFIAAYVAWMMIGLDVLRRSFGVTNEQMQYTLDTYPDQNTLWLGVLLWPWTMKENCR